MLWDKSAPLLSLSPSDWACVLSYVLTPIAMSEVCAVSRQLCRRAWSLEAWTGSLIDGTSIRPAGKLAFMHFRLWRRAYAVLAGKWQWGCVSLLLSQQFVLWRWEGGNDHFVQVGNKWVLHSSRPVRVPLLAHVHLHGLHGPVHVALTARRNAGATVAWTKGRLRKGVSGIKLLSGEQVVQQAEGIVALGPTHITFGRHVWNSPWSTAAGATGYVVLVFSAHPEGRLTPCWTAA